MITRRLKASTEKNLAEKCDKALEKSWGMQVPQTKLLVKKTSESLGYCEDEVILCSETN